MDLRKLKTLIDLVSESNVSELEITEAEGKVRIVKAVNGPFVMPAVTQGVAIPSGVVAMPVFDQNVASAQDKSTSVATDSGASSESQGQTIKSPMVGTFYRAASPGAKSLADIGDDVTKGQPVCIVEAMKIMNEIETEVSGRITKVLVENGQAVEFGQPLFIVE